MTLTDDPASHLQEQFPDWAIWRTLGGRWWAWRKLTFPQSDAGCRGSLDADDYDGLESLLQEETTKRAAVTP